MNKRLLVRLVIVMIPCAALAALWLTNDFRPNIPAALVGKWIVDSVDGKPVSGDHKPVVVLRSDGTVQVDLAGHDELAGDLDPSWLHQQFGKFPVPAKLDANSKVTGVQIPRMGDAGGRIALRRIE